MTCNECGRKAQPNGVIFHVDECPFAIIAPGTVGFPADLSHNNYLTKNIAIKAASCRKWQRRASSQGGK